MCAAAQRRQEGSPPANAAGGDSTERKSSEGYRERWAAKKPRKNLSSWLSVVCSACEGLPGAQGGTSRTSSCAHLGRHNL